MASQTEYLILELVGPNTEAGPSSASERRWHERGHAQAASAKAAVSKYVKEKDNRSGTFAAVPSRNFAIVTASVKTETRVLFE